MVAAAIFALLFFIVYVSRTALVGNSAFGGPENIKIYYTIFLIFHIILSTTGAVFGIVTLRLAFKENFVKHKTIGPITSGIWLFSALAGIILYLLLYVLFSVGVTTYFVQAFF